MWPETDIDSKLPLTSFNITHRGLAKLTCYQPTSHPDIRETETERETAASSLYFKHIP